MSTSTTYSQTISTQEFLIPSALQINPTPYNRVLLVGSCLTEELSKRFGESIPGVPCDFILFNNGLDLPENPPRPIQEYTVQLLQIPLRTLLTDAIINLKRFIDNQRAEELLDRAIGMLDIMLDSGTAYNKKYNLLTVVTNFIQPVTTISAAFAHNHTQSDISKIIRKLNDHLTNRVAKLKNVYILDIDSIAATIGKEYVLDDWYHIYSHNSTFYGEWTEHNKKPYYLPHEWLRVSDFRPSKALEFFKVIFRTMDGIVRTCHQIDQVKLVIFDLDNTLWRGQIAEHYRDDVEPPISIGWPEGLAEAIHHLRARGILVAICSKNDESIVIERWEKAHPFGWIELSDFVCRKINWQPKPVNIAEILAETNLTPRSVVFVDDSPVEREAVRSAFPAMRIIGENPFMTRSTLLRAPETQVAALTDESVRRENMIRNQIERERERATTSRDDFLKGLNSTVRISSIYEQSDKNFNRASELINKTNQFNTTGQRWNGSDFNNLFADDGYILTFSVTDRFTDYGMVGVIIIKQNEIIQLVMSCRVLGLEIEEALIASAIEKIRAEKDQPIVATLKKTKENNACQGVFKKLKFTLDATHDESENYKYALSTPNLPAHINLITG